jgi:hypothetical protein
MNLAYKFARRYSDVTWDAASQRSGGTFSAAGELKMPVSLRDEKGRYLLNQRKLPCRL